MNVAAEAQVVTNFSPFAGALEKHYKLTRDQVADVQELTDKDHSAVGDNILSQMTFGESGREKDSRCGKSLARSLVAILRPDRLRGVAHPRLSLALSLGEDLGGDNGGWAAGDEILIAQSRDGFSAVSRKRRARGNFRLFLRLLFFFCVYHI